MIVINSALCSKEFNAAFDALKGGQCIRRTCWPEGQFLKMQAAGIVGVFRSGRTIPPSWMGPSSTESDATDWQVI